MGLQVELGGGELGPVGAPVGPPENHLQGDPRGPRPAIGRLGEVRGGEKKQRGFLAYLCFGGIGRLGESRGAPSRPVGGGLGKQGPGVWIWGYGVNPIKWRRKMGCYASWENEVSLDWTYAVLKIPDKMGPR